MTDVVEAAFEVELSDMKGGADAVPPGKTRATGAKRGHVQDLVLAKLRRGLMIGAFLPGQVMSLRKLAAALDTSPMPVREALSRLLAAHALEELPNRSVCVPRMTDKRIRELFEVRTAVEGMAARDACAKATPELRLRLGEINRELLLAIEKRDLLRCLVENQRFHFTLYRAADSEILMPLIESLWLRAGPTMYVSLLSPDMPWQAEAHVSLLAALDDGDPAAAKRAVERDVTTAGENLLITGAARRRFPLGDLSLTTLDFIQPTDDFGARL